MKQDGAISDIEKVDAVLVNKALDTAREYYNARSHQFSHYQFFVVGDGLVIINSTPDADEKSDWYLWFDTNKWRLGGQLTEVEKASCFPRHLKPHGIAEVSEGLLEMPPRNSCEFMECVKGQGLLQSIGPAKWFEKSCEVPL